MLCKRLDALKTTNRTESAKTVADQFLTVRDIRPH